MFKELCKYSYYLVVTICFTNEGESMYDNIIYEMKKELEQIHLRRHQLIIICGENRIKVIRAVSQELNIPCVNVNLILSEELLEIAIGRRSRKVTQLIDKIVSDGGDVLCFNHIELLFHPQLQQDPMTIFENISRNKIVIIAWNGKFANGTLTYAKAGHQEYRLYNQLEAIVFTTD